MFDPVIPCSSAPHGRRDAMPRVVISILNAGTRFRCGCVIGRFRAAHVASIPGTEAAEETVNRLLQLGQYKAAGRELNDIMP